MNKTYDIFISFKNNDKMGQRTKDSVLAEKCYRYLVGKGFNVFFSNEELEINGKSNYSESIDDALDSSRFLIAVGCSKDHFESGWVRYEWDSFLNAIRSGVKLESEVFVLYADMKIPHELPWALRMQQAFDGNDDESFVRLSNYIENVARNTAHSPAVPNVGDLVEFGGYNWRVLDIQGNSALLLSDRVIEERWYHSEDVDITWEGCALRKYLNGDFYNINFNKDEKSCIAETNIVNSGNPWYGTDGGRNTNDKIFLLSLEDVVLYFGDSGQLRNRPSNGLFYISDKYSDARIAVDGKVLASWWWLRSPGLSPYGSARVRSDGNLDVAGRGVYSSGVGGGVRPALWINL